MKGLVILDGPDAVGKTTLARALLKASGDKIVKCADGDEYSGYVHLQYYPDKELWRLQYYTLIKAAWRLSRGLLTVIDRHWPSELIYSRAFRDGTHMNAESRGWDRVIRRLCGVYVCCAPLPELCVERHMQSDKHEMYKPGPEIADVAQRYFDWFYGNSAVEDVDYITQIAHNGGMCKRDDALLYDINKHGHDLDLMCAHVGGLLEALQDTQFTPALDYLQPNFLGHLRNADVLFVGDEINPRKCGRWPFIDFGASSAFMSSILHDLQFDETRGLWTNSKAKDEHLQAIFHLRPELLVVALGQNADMRLSERQIPHKNVFHPSFAKRFGYRDSLEQQLREIL
jgi:hypothetical protein